MTEEQTKQEVVDKCIEAYNKLDEIIGTVQSVLKELQDLRNDILGELPDEANQIKDDEPKDDAETEYKPE